MQARVELRGLRLSKESAPFHAAFEPGACVAVCGPPGSGKSALIGVIAGRLRPNAGEAHVHGTVAEPGFPSFTLRTSPQALARRACAGKLSAAAEAMGALGLWDVRRTPWPALSPSQQAACALLPLFGPDASVSLVDGALDPLGPWVLGGAIDALRERGGVFVAATARPDIAQALGRVLVLRGSDVRFCGTVDELVLRARPARLVVETGDPGAVRAICEPFSLEVEEHPGGVCLTTHDGEEVAARLLLQGYGSVRSVVIRHASVAEALSRI